MGSRYAGNIRRADLLADTPYNTYTRDGLPPTPIAMVGVAAIRAATQPADGDELFFVAVGDGSGRHVFSRTLAEHNAAVREYVRRYRERFGQWARNTPRARRWKRIRAWSRSRAARAPARPPCST